MAEFSRESTQLIEDLNRFIDARSVNENFRFWAQFLSMMAVVHDILRADREGIWELHLDAVQRALFLFAAFDSTNYLRWCSVYLEDMRRLPETAPSVHQNFSNGNFSIKDRPGRFIAVGGDQKLEQSINLSSKCSDGVIGHAKRKEYIAQWDLIYHEMVAVKNLHRTYTNVMDRTHESSDHHESSKGTTLRKESQIQEMVKFIEEKGSPMSLDASHVLHNLVTKEIMSTDIRNDILNAVTKGKEKYLMFRRKRIVEKTNRLSESIHRMNLKTMKFLRSKPQKTVKMAVKEMNIAERAIEIARDRGLSTDELLNYDVAPSPLLFEDGIMTKPSKSLLLKEFESHLKKDDYDYRHRNNSAFVIDVMAAVRKVHLTNLSNFGDFLSGFLSLSETFHQFGRCDYVFDMYIPDSPSVKDSERLRRGGTPAVEYSSLEPQTPLPKEIETFWPSSMNKLLLEKMLYSHLRSKSHKNRIYPTVLGQLSRDEEDWQCIMVHQGKEIEQSHLNSSFEEADLSILIHVLDSLGAGHTVAVVISNDADVIVALLYHMPVFLQHGLEELWVRAGVGDTTRYVPLHKLFKHLGNHLCSVLPAVHSLTGCDITSKVGTKKAALKAEPEKFLRQFGKLPILTTAVTQKAENYLVKVMKNGSDSTNFSDLRREMFHFSKGATLHNLPPTSQGLLPHIQRGFYNAYTMMHALDSSLDSQQAESLKPEDYGYQYDEGHLTPVTSWKTLEEQWSVVCSCTKCSKSTCSCRMAKTKCTKFCHCKKHSLKCKNPLGWSI